MTRKNPDRPLYVTIPRDLDKHPDFGALSLPAQWLLQHLERDPYRLSCGVFVLNPSMVAKAAHATTPDVLEWFGEIVAHGWAQHDEETSEVWLTAHMGWDFTLSSPNGAKGVLRDLKRVHSDRLGGHIERLVYARFPSLNPSEGIDPGWNEPPPGNAQEGATEGAYRLPAGTPEPKPTPEAHTPEPEATSRRTEPEAHSPSPKPEARDGATCAECGGDGITATGACECPTGQQISNLNQRHLAAVKDSA